MKKQNEKQPKRVMPAFATEAEEAAWWYKNRNIHGKQMLAAAISGEAKVLTSACGKTYPPTRSKTYPPRPQRRSRQGADGQGVIIPAGGGRRGHFWHTYPG